MNLPKIYQNNNIINNNDQEYFVSSSTPAYPKSSDIKEDIEKIFNNRSFIYKAKVEIITDKETITTTIIGKTNKYVITINNELIPIKDIKKIKKLDT